MTTRPGSRDVPAIAPELRGQSNGGQPVAQMAAGVDDVAPAQPGRWSSDPTDATPLASGPHRAGGVAPGDTVYAHVARDGAILYIGRTANLEQRTKQHRSKPWWPEVADVRSLHAGLTHEQSVQLERQEIEAHNPPHNFVYTEAWRGRAGHGYVAYTRGCRCDECRAAKAAYIRERRRVAREIAARLSTDLTGNRGREWTVGTERHYVPGVRHGTSYAYYERGCRCFDCTRWETATSVARQRRVRQRRTAA